MANKKRVKVERSDYVKDVLIKYTTFLQDNGYIDTDATMEHPSAIDRFLNKYENKTRR